MLELVSLLRTWKLSSLEPFCCILITRKDGKMGEKKRIQGRVLKAHVINKEEGFTGEMVTYVVPETSKKISKEEFFARIAKRREES